MKEYKMKFYFTYDSTSKQYELMIMDTFPDGQYVVLPIEEHRQLLERVDIVSTLPDDEGKSDLEDLANKREQDLRESGMP